MGEAFDPDHGLLPLSYADNRSGAGDYRRLRKQQDRNAWHRRASLKKSDPFMFWTPWKPCRICERLKRESTQPRKSRTRCHKTGAGIYTDAVCEHGKDFVRFFGPTTFVEYTGDFERIQFAGEFDEMAAEPEDIAVRETSLESCWKKTYKARGIRFLRNQPNHEFSPLEQISDDTDDLRSGTIDWAQFEWEDCTMSASDDSEFDLLSDLEGSAFGSDWEQL